MWRFIIKICSANFFTFVINPHRMKNRIFCLVLFLIQSFVFSQNRSFIYELKYQTNPDKESVTTEKFILDVKDGKSLFRSIKDKETDSLSYSTGRQSFVTTSFKDFFGVSKDLSKNITNKFINNFQTFYTIKVDEKISWKIENETKYILGLKSQKATVNYGGRSWTAWFTGEIPLQEGPYVFSGLPGLITEISDSKNDYHFTLVQIKKFDGKLYEKAKPLPVSWKQYEKLAKDYYSDPTREINGKNSGSSMQVMRWVDEKGNEIKPDFKAMNEREQKEIRINNNPIELNHKINYE